MSSMSRGGRDSKRVLVGAATTATMRDQKSSRARWSTGRLTSWSFDAEQEQCLCAEQSRPERVVERGVERGSVVDLSRRPADTIPSKLSRVPLPKLWRNTKNC